jgi:rhodanese-related sulfurtransferase
VGDAKAAFDLEQAVFVDVRERAFYNESHIPGALSIPLNEIEARLGELNSSDWIITYCT